MLKTRVIPTLLYKDFGLVKGIGFDSRRAVGSLMQAVKVYEMRQVDELVFLDVGASDRGGPDLALVDDMADECFMPLAVGGGVRSVDDVRGLLRVGADKVVIGTGAVEVPGLVEDVAASFGSQCAVVAVDVVGEGDDARVAVRSGRVLTDLTPVEHARAVAAAGAGEILLQSVRRDGTMAGYDLETLRQVTAAVSVPVIASGGAGSYAHMVAALEGGADAVAAASMFHFTEQTPLEAKDYLAERGLPVRGRT